MIVDEKRRRTDNDVSTSKKYETRSNRKKDGEAEGEVQLKPLLLLSCNRTLEVLLTSRKF